MTQAPNDLVGQGRSPEHLERNHMSFVISSMVFACALLVMAGFLLSRFFPSGMSWPLG